MTRTLVVLALVLAVGCDCGKKKQATPAPGSAAPAPAAGSGAAGSGTPSAAQAAPPGAVPTACDLGASAVKGNEGASWLMTCPAGCPAKSVWGTDIYTDDSVLCSAAIHAGAITAKDGGTVLVTWAPTQPTYIGSERNGISSDDYHSWPRSFYVQKIDAQGKATSPAPTLITAPNTAHLSCKMNAGPLTGDAGTKWNVDCPSGCTGGNVWGSDVYTADSVICWAAIHAGVIDAKGGPFVVTITGKQDKMTGSTRNGVTTDSYGAYERTYTVAKP